MSGSAGLQAMIGESVQTLVLPGSCVDTYYAGISNVEKQCFPSRVQNKFYITLNSARSGAENVLLFNPNAGLTDMVLTLQLPDLSGVAGLALNRGWGYRMLESLSFRYASAPQFFVQGQQHFISVMDSCENGVKRDQLVQLGGQALLTPADFADPVKRTAYVYIKFPHNSPKNNKPLPYTSDLTTQPFQTTIQLADWTRVFLNGSAISSGLQQFQTAQLCYRQVELNNSADYLAQRENMSKMMYIYPLDRFEQRQVAIPLLADGSTQSVQLTGFRSGEIKSIVLWAVDNADIQATPTGNWFNYVPLQNVVLTVNGDVRYDGRLGSPAMWDLISNETSSSWNNTVITAGTPNTATATTGYWTKIPLGQKESTLANEFELTHGYSVMNSVLNLQIQVPANAAGYTLFAAYWYASCLSIHSGQVDFVF